MVPDYSTMAGEPREPLVVTAVHPDGWETQCGDIKIRCRHAHFATGRIPAVGDRIGFLGESGLVFNNSLVFQTIGEFHQVVHIRSQPQRTDLPVMSLPAHVEKPYLARNRAPWQKRKKGRHP